MLQSIIRIDRQEVLDLCRQKLRRIHPDRPESQLTDDLGGFIDEVAQALGAHGCPPGRPSVLPLDHSAARHGERRYQQQYRAADLVNDYGELCHAITEVAARRGVRPTWRELQVLIRCGEAATARAIEQHAALARAQWERESREHFGSIAHELRNALSSATTGFEVIRRATSALPAPTAELVVRNLKVMADLIGQQLGHVRTHAGVPTRCQLLHLAPLIERVRATAASRRGVGVVVDVDRSIVCHADEQMLTSAIGNLLHNAIKFTRDGGTVTVRGREAMDRVSLDVEDQCGGLPRGAVDDLFRPFVQRGDDRTGAGLGLTIARRAVEAHGGTITVRDLPGRGCVFRIELVMAASTRRPSSVRRPKVLVARKAAGRGA